MLILEDLYVGDVRPNERSFKRNSQYAEALDELVKVGDELTATLTEKEKELFEDFMDAPREVTVLTDCETFCFAFKLGAKIMLDVLTDTPMKEISFKTNLKSTWETAVSGFPGVCLYKAPVASAFFTASSRRKNMPRVV